MNQVAISVKDLSKKYPVRRNGSRRLLDFLGLRVGRANRQSDGFWALQDVNFTMQPGECIGLIGANGAGKSTLFSILSGIYAPTHGQAVIRGKLQALIALGAGFHPALSGRENVYINAAILGMSGKRVDELMEKLRQLKEALNAGKDSL